MADIKVFSTHAVQEVLCELGPAFERASGARLAIRYDPANALKHTIEDGAAFDVAIVTRAVIDALAKQRKIVHESCTDIARSGLGIAVRKGAAKPDVATVNAFKRALLAAKSVARSKEGTSGLYFDMLLTRLGIAEAMRGRVVLGGSGRIAELVARGEAVIAVPLPDELQLYTVFSAGVSAACKAKDVATSLIDALTTPAAAVLLKAKGLEPMLR
jgi:molybdate transport system substrate-binding protein